MACSLQPSEVRGIIPCHLRGKSEGSALRVSAGPRAREESRAGAVGHAQCMAELDCELKETDRVIMNNCREVR